MGKSFPSMGKSFPSMGKSIPSMGKSIPSSGKSIPSLEKIFPLREKIFPPWKKFSLVPCPSMVKRLPEKIKSMVNSFPSIENYKARNVLKQDFLGIF